MFRQYRIKRLRKRVALLELRWRLWRTIAEDTGAETAKARALSGQTRWLNVNSKLMWLEGLPAAPRSNGLAQAYAILCSSIALFPLFYATDWLNALAIGGVQAIFIILGYLGYSYSREV